MSFNQLQHQRSQQGYSGNFFHRKNLKRNFNSNRNDDSQYENKRSSFEGGDHNNNVHSPTILTLTNINWSTPCAEQRNAEQTIRGSMACIYDNENCGSVSEDRRFDKEVKEPYLLVGPFCEYHYVVHMNGMVTRFVHGRHVTPLLVNYTELFAATPMFPVWSLLSLNSTHNEVKSLIYEHDKKNIVSVDKDLKVISAWLAAGTDTDAKVNKFYLQTFIRFNTAFESRMNTDGRYWKNDHIFVYLSDEFVEKNKNHSLVHKITAAADNEYLVARKTTGIYDKYKVSIREFCVLDILLFKSFEPSQFISDNRTINLMHNVQIIDGMFVYGTGKGLRQEVVYSDDNIDPAIKYVRKVDSVIERRGMVVNHEPLVLDMQAHDTRKKSFFSKEAPVLDNVNINTLAELRGY